MRVLAVSPQAIIFAHGYIALRVVEQIHVALDTHVGMIPFLGYRAVTRYAGIILRFGGQLRQLGHCCNMHENHGNYLMFLKEMRKEFIDGTT